MSVCGGMNSHFKLRVVFILVQELLLDRVLVAVESFEEFLLAINGSLAL